MILRLPLRQHLFIVSLFAIFAFVLPNVSTAQWTPTGGPEGGAVHEFVRLNGANITATFAATDNGIYRSNDDGQSWTPSGLQGKRVLHIIQYIGDFSVGDNLIATTESALYRSQDAGVSWKLSYGGDSLSADSLQIVSLVQLNIHLLLSTVSNGSNGGIYLSNDGGSNWSRSTINPAVYGLHDLVSGGSVLLGISQNDSELFQGNETGSNWTKATFPVNLHPTLLRSTGTSLFAGFDGGILISTNFGTDWITPANGGLDSFDVVTQFATHGLTMVIAAGNKSFISNDAARSWQQDSISKFSADSGYTSLGYIGSTFLASTRGGIFRSTNDGLSWTIANKGVVASDNRFLASDGRTPGPTLFSYTPLGVSRSIDHGTTWVSPVDTTDLSEAHLKLLTSLNGDVYACGNGFWKWDGTSWNLLSPIHFRNVILEGSDLLGATATNSILRSNSGGHSWSSANFGLPAASVLKNYLLHSGTHLIDIVNDSVPASGFSTVFYQSIDGGMTWIATDSLRKFVEPLSDANNATGTFVAVCGSDSLLVTHDGGDHWSFIAVPFSGPVLAIAPLGPALIAGAASSYNHGGGVYYSIDGAHWSLVSDGLDSTLSFESFASDEQYLYGGTTNSGVWKRDLSTLDVKPASADAVSVATLSLVPNPASQATSARFQIKGPSHVNLALYDMSGARVRLFIDRQLSSGFVDVPLDCASLASGRYSVVLTIDGKRVTGSLVVAH